MENDNRNSEAPKVGIEKFKQSQPVPEPDSPFRK